MKDSLNKLIILIKKKKQLGMNGEMMTVIFFKFYPVFINNIHTPSYA